MIREIRAFILGAIEFRRAFTTHMGPDLIHAYDCGREWAHRLTLRHWDK